MSVRFARRLDGVERTLIRRIFDEAPSDAINLGLGEPDLATPPAVSLAGIRGIAHGRTGYTPTAGDPELRRAVADQYAPAGIRPEGVLVTVGSQEAVFACCLALVDPGDEVLCPDPGYPSYPTVARLAGALPVTYPLSRKDGFRLRAEALLDRLTERTRLVVINTPANPTGAAAKSDQLARVLSVLGARGIAWVSDEIYAGFRYGEEHVSALELSSRGGFVVSGLSKSLSMTGWRVGWVVGEPAAIARVSAVHQHLVTCASSVSQRAALGAFTEAGLKARLRGRELFARRRELMANELSRLAEIEFEPPDGAFYYFVDVSRYGDDLELCRRILHEHGVLTIPGRAFGEGGRGFLRISFAASEGEIRTGVAAIRAGLGA
jgi:aspartate aminotransferase